MYYVIAIKDNKVIILTKAKTEEEGMSIVAKLNSEMPHLKIKIVPAYTIHDIVSAELTFRYFSNSQMGVE